jgi:predicted nucleic acid-binding Zn ribbon protein
VPVYVYRRRDGSIFETEQRIAEDAPVDCPTIGQTGAAA